MDGFSRQTSIVLDEYTYRTTTQKEHAGYQVEGYEARDDCAAWSVEEGIQIQAKP